MNVSGTDPEGVRVWRGDEIESVHEVHAAVADPDGQVVARRGDPECRTYLRSAAKPVQVLPLVEEGLVDRFGFSGQELAVMAASHGGEPFHVAAVERILEKAGVDGGLLRCGPHAPLHEPSAAALRAAGREPTPLHNNCSGKHAGMLAVCRALGWPVATYLEPDHPLQERIWLIVADLAGLPAAGIGRAIDGCGVPSFALPVRAMAVLYARLAAADGARDSDLARAVGLVLDAMAAHPEYVAGTGRLCTDLMARAGGRVVVKTGAEGVYCAALRGQRRGLALKVADGARRAQDVALLALFAGIGVVEPAGDPVLAGHLAPPVTNRSGAVVGRIDARLPLESPA
ncbi:MAG TPA: asparaginase [Gemmatimonadota bacterium]|nr:asparaginase [Gemmatimonadota bacterium]